MEQEEYDIKPPVLDMPATTLGMYILNEDHTIRKADTVLQWGEQFNSERRKVALTKVGKYYVSTVFLGIDHGFNYLEQENYQPLLFETMIWKSVNYRRNFKPNGLFANLRRMGRMKWLNFQDRYRTWDEAKKGHNIAIQYVKDVIKSKPAKSKR